MPNVWRFKAVDKDGKPVESAPGATTFTCRGPTNPIDMKAAATLLLNSKRVDAIRAGFADPGYKLDEESLVAVEHSDHDLGAWIPKEAKPIQMPHESAPGEPKEADPAK